MEQGHKLSHFSELKTTELDQIVGGGWWDDFIRAYYPNTRKTAPLSLGFA
ncbi:TPA: ComC/BlpC family leader-containing pheromone/bacteriocin [Streptococcus pyogenes]|nr:double glycine cleavage site bacteriolysin superfamily [Streptococcus pyogenes]VGQ71692.1 double glycine cleavage site bacteriolysin superfamily [Streptococcus pyogenes]VGU92361.1 double glycine cleavage site bacteriolysin superfamily [Streptococcus pyogenes]HEP1412766.1 ComC/BlpC family leader-containing pheromone/bacteriocin [Streptococcus pyogenes]